MTTAIKDDLDLILEIIEQLPTKALLSIQAKIVTQLQHRLTTETPTELKPKIGSNGQTPAIIREDDEPDKVPLYPGSQLYEYTEKGRKKWLAERFTPEELERLEKFDPNTLPETSIPMSEMVNILRGKVEE